MTTFLGYLMDWLSVNPNAIVILWGLEAIVVTFTSFLTRGWVEKDERSEWRPTLAFAVSLAAGILILAHGIPLTDARETNFDGPSDLRAIFAAVGYAQSIVVFSVAAMLPLVRARHQLWGVVIILFSVASALVGGGFILGSVLGSIGGVLVVNRYPSGSGTRRPSGGDHLVGVAAGTPNQPQPTQTQERNREPAEPADDESSFEQPPL